MNEYVGTSFDNTYHLELGKILNTNHLILQELNCPGNMKRTKINIHINTSK